MVDILLATYNGEKFLRQQLDSIIEQSYSKWRLIVRDDSSTDGTVGILQEYIRKYPKQIILIDKKSSNLGSSKSFARLLDFVESDYFMFSDQDDLWLPNKIEETMKEMKRLEQAICKDVPLMVCCDAECIDGKNHTICPSFFDSQKFVDTTGDDIKLLALNVVQGSTTLMNKKVLDYVRPIPSYVLHDQWIAVITAHFGKVFYLHKQLLKYRQHGHNVLGALDVGPKYFIKKILNSKKQIQTYMSFYSNLPFHVNIAKWMFLKMYYSLKRL